jgi:iron complex outermembrane receptor protein
MRVLRRSLWLSALALSAPVAARAQEAPARTDPPAAQGVTTPQGAADDDAPVGEGVVSSRRAPSRAAGEVDATVGQLANVPRTNASDVLRLAPGIFLSNGLGDGHAEQVFLRGFDARLGQDLEFTVNGVPINEPAHPHGQGHADTHFIIPEVIDSVRVLEGPFDPHQGDFAVAGSAQFNLRVPTRGAVLQYRYGSFDTHRALGLWAPEGESPGTFGAAEYGSSAGYGQNRGYDRATANAQYEHRSGALTVRLFGASYLSRYRSAGVLRDDDVAAGRADFYGTYDATQGGEVARHLLSVEVESNRRDSTLKAQAWGSVRDFRIRENFTGFLLDVQQPWQSAHPQRGDLIDQNGHSTDVGARASGRFQTTLGGLRHSLEVGLYGRFVSVDSTQTRLRSGTDIPYGTDFTLQSDVGNVAFYVDAELRFTRWLTLRGGLRGDLFQYNVLDRCAVSDVSVRGAALDVSCLSADRVGYREPFTRRSSGGFALQPRASLFAGPFKGFTVALAAGLGARSADPVYLGNDQTLPYSPATALEAGVIYDRRVGATRLSARALGFYTRVGQDLIFDETQGRNSIAGSTTRLGALAAVRATHPRFDISAHVTWARATFDDGFLVPYVPQLVARLDASANGPLPARVRGRALTVSGGLGVTYVAPRPLPLAETGDAVFTVDAQVATRWAHLELGLVAQNLFDAQYRWGQYNFVSDFRSRPFPTLVAARHFAAGPPRSLFVVFTVHLGSAAARHGAPTGSP